MATLRLGTISLMLSIVLWGTLLGGIVYSHLVYLGITDPVEWLKIIHQPSKFDPLLNRIPHATPTDQLYSELSRSDQLRLAKHAESLIGTEHNDEIQDYSEGIYYAFVCPACRTTATGYQQS